MKPEMGNRWGICRICGGRIAWIGFNGGSWEHQTIPDDDHNGVPEGEETWN